MTKLINRIYKIDPNKIYLLIIDFIFIYNMGSICSSSYGYEDSLSYIFNNLPSKFQSTFKINDLIIDQSKEDKIFDKVKSNIKLMQTISLSKIPYSKEESFNRCLYETNYQNIIYKFYLTPGYEKELYEYFVELYKQIPEEIRYPCIRIILVMFSKFDLNLSLNLFIDLFYYLSMYSFSERMNQEQSIPFGKSIKNECLFQFLNIYLNSISRLTIKFLMPICLKGSFNKEVCDHYENLWTEKNIMQFIKNNFFKKDDKPDFDKNIEPFLKEHLELLLDISSILKKLTEESEMMILEANTKEEKAKLIYKKVI